MKNSSRYDVAVIGAGIVGLAIAYNAALEGKKVVVFEKNKRAVGASIRNFGMIWPIGQPKGVDRNRALQSRNIWKKLAAEAGFWTVENGSLHLAYHDDEMQVLEEFVEAEQSNDAIQLISPEKSVQLNRFVKKEGLKGALWSNTEMLVDPREAIQKIPAFLQKQFKVAFHFSTTITHVDRKYLYSFDAQWTASEIFVCSGADFETLYPQIYRETNITKCKLQMMRGIIPNEKSHMGASLCAGLTLLHYGSFADCPSLLALAKRFEEENNLYKKHGIHVLLSQNELGEFIIGDSHSYDWNVLPFDKEEINTIILDYLSTFSSLPGLKITERWNGVYPKLHEAPFLVEKPDPAVTIVNGLGGAGMTLSFGLAAEILSKNVAASNASNI